MTRLLRGLAIVTLVVAGVSAFARPRPAVSIDVTSATPSAGNNCGCGMPGGCCGGAKAPAAQPAQAKPGCGCGMR